jgi:DNA helicase-2/ATP-dependent DNA helicase PcrA
VRLSNSVSRPFGGNQSMSGSNLFSGSEIPQTGFSLGQPYATRSSATA